MVDLLSYLISATAGHCRLLLARKSILPLVRSRNTPEALRERLSFVLRVRNFATEELRLPDNGSYRCYAEVRQPAVVWAVYAAPELSTEPILWRYPIVGSMVYRAYSSREAAERFAAKLRRQGNDTYIHGSAAYSTLGWFDDPVLDTFVNWPDQKLAGLIFHELAHQTIFVRDDSFFNEAFAVAVEREGIRRWAQAEGLGGYTEEEDLDIRQTLDTRERLAALYSSGLPREEKLRAKGDQNNAYLVRIATYYSYLPYFENLLDSLGGDLTKFYSAVSELARLPSPARPIRHGTSEE